MFAWVESLIDRLPGFLKGAFRAVADVLLAPWRLLVSFFAHIVRGAVAFLTGVLHFVTGLGAFIHELVNGLTRLVTTIIPGWIRTTVDNLKRWAGWAIEHVVGPVRAILHTLEVWAKATVKWLTDRLLGFIKWATGHISDLLSWLSRVGNRVADLVLHPDKLAAWLVPHLWTPVWRFVVSRAEPIGRWFLRNAARAALAGAHLIEDVIAAIL